MVSHFGEVTFPSSRAFWDDDDEYEPEQISDPTLHLHWLQKPERIKQFIVIEGDPLNSFMVQSLRDPEEACVVENEHHRKVSVIYKIEGHTYLCIILPQFDTKAAGKLVEHISDLLLSAENTVAIVCRHTSQFQSSSVPESSFLRVLTTKNAKTVTDRKIESLEQPNIVFGVGAGVLSYAEFSNRPAVLYVLYVDSLILDSKYVEPVVQILPDEVRCKLRQPKFAEHSFNKGNLYT